MKTPELKSNEYYLVVSDSGDYLKTRFKDDFLKVSFWKGVIFSQIVENHKYLFYTCFSKTYKKQISRLKIAKHSSETIYQDIELLDNPFKIKSVWIGGLKDNEYIEKL